MEEYPVKQLQPNHADHISYYKDDYLKNMFVFERVVGQLKYDGERMLIHIDRGNVYCTSRRFSKKTNRYMENQDKLPVVKEIFSKYRDLRYTVLDCECYSTDWSTIAGILHSLPERAIELQKKHTVLFAVFDCLYFDGQDCREFPYETRLYIANNFVQNVNHQQLRFVKFMHHDGDTIDYPYSSYCADKEEANAWMEAAIAKGYEGIVLKSLSRSYYDKGASLKCKKFETVDVVVIDYVQGNGKYSNTIGALKVGYYDPIKGFVTISNVNCSTDEERNLWRDNWNEWKYSVIEVKCQEITSKSLRHPRYVRKRDDKDYKMCTYDTIFK